MSEVKKSVKSKLFNKDISELHNNSLLEKSVPKKKGQKRQIPSHDQSEEEGDISKLIEMYQTKSKKNKNEANFESKESKQKLLDVLGQQLESRKSVTTNFLQSLMGVVTQIETDNEALSENEKKLEHLTNVFLKCIKQTNLAQKQILEALKDITTKFKNECDQLESNHRAEAGKLADELEEDINKLQQQLVAETKRKQYENLRRTIFNAIQNDF